MAKGNQSARHDKQKIIFYFEQDEKGEMKIKYEGLPSDPMHFWLSLDQIMMSVKVAYLNKLQEYMNKNNILPQQEGVVEPPVGEKVITDDNKTEEHNEGNN